MSGCQSELTDLLGPGHGRSPGVPRTPSLSLPATARSIRAAAPAGPRPARRRATGAGGPQAEPQTWNRAVQVARPRRETAARRDGRAERRDSRAERRLRPSKHALPTGRYRGPVEARGGLGQPGGVFCFMTRKIVTLQDREILLEAKVSLQSCFQILLLHSQRHIEVCLSPADPRQLYLTLRRWRVVLSVD